MSPNQPQRPGQRREIFLHGHALPASFQNDPAGALMALFREYRPPGPVQRFADMPPEKQAEMRRLYERPGKKD